jgi:hypothetical protein
MERRRRTGHRPVTAAQLVERTLDETLGRLDQETPAEDINQYLYDKNL